jgi:divalent metal cation (Fe/Co/Zn/Cd) transporter
VQLPLKILAYQLAGDNSGPFFAELKRSVIDTLNHFVLKFINSVNTKPSIQYPYGMVKLQNIVCYIPAGLFIVSGIHTIIESISSLVEHDRVSQLPNFGSITVDIRDYSALHFEY